MHAERAGARAAWIVGALAGAFAVPLALGEPFWQTVDDAFMVMIAHGYGITAAPSAALVFSNVLYGMLLQAAGVPALGGAQLYGVFSYGLLASAAAAAGYALWRATDQGALAAAALLAVYAPSVLYPQFTVLAGLLAVSSLLLLVADARAPAAVIAFVLLMLGLLVRAEQVVVTLLFTAPFWAIALRRAPRAQLRTSVIVLAVAAAGLIASFAVDRAYYSGSEWEQFRTMNKTRMLFTDYGLRHYFIAEQARPAQLGFIPTDLVMMEGWFFSDPRVFSPERVAELTRDVSILGWVTANSARYRELVLPFRDEWFLAPLLLAVVVAWRARSLAAFWMLGALAAAMLAALLAGRPGITRIYVPPVAGILLFTLAVRPVRLTRLYAAVVAASLVVIGGMLVMRNDVDREESQIARARLCKMPPERLYVVWAERLPYEKLYRPLSRPGDECVLDIYPLAVHSYAPYALERLRAATGATDVIGALLAGRRLDLVSDKGQIEVLDRFLRVHYRRALDWELLGGDGGRGTWYAMRLLPAQ